MTVYFVNELRKSYSYGMNGQVDGYLAPVKFLKDHDAIRKMIGYRGDIVVIDSKGNEYVGN